MNRLYSSVLSLVTIVFVTLVIICPSSSRAREVVHLRGYSEGTIIVKTSQRRPTITSLLIAVATLTSSRLMM
jgi:hypothetical protein